MKTIILPWSFHAEFKSIIILWVYNACYYNQLFTPVDRGVARSKNVGWTHMASAKREPITGVWRRSPQRGPGAEPLVRKPGGEAPWSWKTFSFWMPTEAANLPHSPYFANSLNPRYLWYISQKTEGIVHDGMDNTVYQQKNSLELYLWCEK